VTLWSSVRSRGTEQFSGGDAEIEMPKLRILSRSSRGSSIREGIMVRIFDWIFSACMWSVEGLKMVRIIKYMCQCY